MMIAIEILDFQLVDDMCYEHQMQLKHPWNMRLDVWNLKFEIAIQDALVLATMHGSISRQLVKPVNSPVIQYLIYFRTLRIPRYSC